jgi:hypothetical protein
MTSRSHMRNVDRLIEFHREAIAQMHRDFLQDVEELRTEFMTERQVSSKLRSNASCMYSSYQ